MHGSFSFFCTLCSLNPLLLVIFIIAFFICLDNNVVCLNTVVIRDVSISMRMLKISGVLTKRQKFIVNFKYQSYSLVEENPKSEVNIKRFDFWLFNSFRNSRTELWQQQCFCARRRYPLAKNFTVNSEIFWIMQNFYKFLSKIVVNNFRSILTNLLASSKRA